MRILAADDDDAMARTLDRALRSWGYEAVIAHDGHEAWKILKREDAPLLAILDWDMPGLTGIEVCRLLRSTQHGGNVYVLMLTARQEKNDLVSALESGADDFLSKPFHSRELQLRLAKGVRDALRARGGEPGDGRSPPPTGTTLGNGKYRLERQIARGGMGSVWLGVHLSLGVNVAIKFMDAHLAETADYASFEREARAAAQLRSEHTVRIYDHGIDRAGLPYLVMEYLDGESLWSRIDRKGPRPAAEVVACVDHVARALGEAHGRQIVHRDVKPENILFLEDIERPEGFSAKLIDFGLANRSTGGRPAVGPTAGTPSYMSPEYLRAEVGPTPALDLWGVAATAFVAMTGAVPFDGDTLNDVYHRVCNAPPPLPSRVAPHVPPGFDAWFLRACAADPAARFQSAAELASALAVACTEPAHGLGAPTISGPQDVGMLPSMATEPDSVGTVQARKVSG